MGVKETFLSFGAFMLHDGNQIRFSKDTWSGDQPLKTRKVAGVLSTILVNLEFRRNLVGNKPLEWNHIVVREWLILTCNMVMMVLFGDYIKQILSELTQCIVT